MSTSTPFDSGTQPAGDFSADPLLASGSFISSTNPAGDGTLNSSSPTRPQIREVIGSVESIRVEMSNGTDQMNPSMQTPTNPAESKSRKRVTPGDNWLPPGWRVEDKVRISGATAGSVDKYYYEPNTGRRFRSRTEVMYYLEHGTAKKSNKKAENTDFSSDHVEGQGSKKARKKSKEPSPPPLPQLIFDFENPPESVKWSMTNAGEQAWIPFIGDGKVQDAMRQDWFNAFTIITTKNASKLS